MNEVVDPYLKGAKWLKRRASLELSLHNGMLVVVPGRLLEEFVDLPNELSDPKVVWRMESVGDVHILEDGMTIGLTLNVHVEGDHNISSYASSYITQRIHTKNESDNRVKTHPDRVNEKTDIQRIRSKNGRQRSMVSLKTTISVPDMILSPVLRNTVIRNWASTIGSKKTPAKAESSRQNGKKGGRPTTTLRGE